MANNSILITVFWAYQHLLSSGNSLLGADAASGPMTVAYYSNYRHTNEESEDCISTMEDWGKAFTSVFLPNTKSLKQHTWQDTAWTHWQWKENLFRSSCAVWVILRNVGLILRTNTKSPVSWLCSCFWNDFNSDTINYNKQACLHV